MLIDCRHIELEPCPDGKKGPPGVFLCCDYRGKRVACKVKFSFIYINKKDPAKNYKRGKSPSFPEAVSTDFRCQVEAVHLLQCPIR